MSQEKIDRYKEEKANRKKKVANQKRNAVIAKVVGAVVCLGLIAWIGWSGYRSYQQNKEQEAALESYNQWLEEYMATYESSGATSSTGVNLEQDPSNVTTSDETKEGETTSKEEETTAEEETSAE